MTRATPTVPSRPRRSSWRASDLRPRATLAGLSSYYRCALSPDDTLVAYGVQPARYGTPGNARASVLVLPTGAPRRLEGAELFLADVRRGEPGSARALTPGWGASWGPCWSPDGRRLAFFSDRNGVAQVWVWERDERSDGATGSDGRAGTGGTGELDGIGATARPVCDEPITMRFGHEGLRWLPDNRHFVAKLRPVGWDPYAEAQRAESARPESGFGATGERDVWVSPPDADPLHARQERLHSPSLSRGDVAVIDVETGQARRIGTDVEPRLLAVSPDGRYVAALCERAESGERHDLNVSLFDVRLFQTDALEDSSGTVIAPRIPQAYGTDLSWSPSGDSLAFVSLSEYPTEPGRLIVVGTDGRQRHLFGGDETSFGHRFGFHPPLWSAGGDTLYCWGNRRGGEETAFAVTLASGEVRDLGAESGLRVTEIVSRDGSGVAPHFGQPGTIAALALDPQTRRIGLYRIGHREDAAHDGPREPTRLIPDTIQGLRGLSHNGDAANRWIVGTGTSGASSLIDLYAYDTHTGEPRRLTALNDHLVSLPRLESYLIPMRGLEGEPRQAAVWLPLKHETGKCYPTVVQLYLGSGAGPSRFDPERLALAEAGYVVVQPDMPHVDGVDPAETATRYALLALEAAAQHGVADADRAALLGYSNGGYNVCCVVTQTNRFRAAVAADPFTNLISHALTIRGNEVHSGQVEGEYARMGGTLWQERERYVANSPVFQADRVTTPLLLLCGTADSLLPQAEEMYAALLRLGKVATLVRYHGEGHVPYKDWLDENFEDYSARIVEWLDRHV